MPRQASSQRTVKRRDGVTLRRAVAFMRACLVCMALLAFVSSCSRGGKVYHHYVKIADEGWESGSFVVFSFELDSTVNDIDLDVGLRINNNYAYANIWLEFTMQLPGYDELIVDTLFVRTVYNDWRRFRTFTAGLYSVSVPFRTVKAPGHGVAEIRVRHLMDAPMLAGVNDVGLEIRRSRAE